MSDDSRGKNEDGKLLYCSFCGKSQHEVRKLIAGPSVFICDECVELCNDIIREELEDAGETGRDKLPKPLLNEYILLIGKLSNRINDERMRETFVEQIYWMRSVIETVQKEHKSHEITDDIVREAKKRVTNSE